MPDTEYKETIKEDVLRYTEYGKVATKDEVKFHTAPLQLNDAQVMWVLQDESSRTAVPQFNLHFNYAVKPEELKEKLSVEIEGKKTDYSFQTISPSEEVAIRLLNFKGEDKNYEAKIKIAKGLAPLNGSKNTDEAMESLLSIPSPYVLNINNVEAEHDGTEGSVRISTSQQLTGENISSLISFEPAVKFTVEYNDFGLLLRSPQFSAEESYAMTITKGLRGKIGGVLRENYNGSVAFGAIEAGITFTSSKAVYLSKKGGGNMEVRITNVPKVKLIISKIYENNLLYAESHGYYPKDDYDEEYASYREGNEDYINATLGDVIYSKEIDTRSLPKSGAGRILNIAPLKIFGSLTVVSFPYRTSA